MKELQLNLTIEEVNIILSALGDRPYIQVLNLIPKIHQQANNQLNGPSIKKEGN